MALTRKDVEHIALLARMELSESEKEKFGKQLSLILEHAGKISSLKLEDVKPTSHVQPVENVFREDLVEESLPREEALANAPEREDDAFLVPKIV